VRPRCSRHLSTSGSSKNWLERQRRDVYVKKAALAGFRARSAFKLLEINDKHRLVRRGDVVIDLGGAPGGWAQVAAELAGCDALPPAPALIVAAQAHTSPASAAPMLAAAAGASGPAPAAGAARARKSVLSVAREEVLHLQPAAAAVAGCRHETEARTPPNLEAVTRAPGHASMLRRQLSSSASSPWSHAVSASSSSSRARHVDGVDGLVVSADLLPIAPLPGCRILQGDFTAPAVHAAMMQLLRDEARRHAADVILSDMAHNFSGDSGVDHVRQMQLAWTALVFADKARDVVI
jgi:23S rRNA U2552 (ribose-2'-O)-methylase RlmE/FtsJ